MNTRRPNRAPAPLAALAATLVLALVLAAAPAPAAEETLNVFVWSEYLPDAVVKGFAKETGVKVRVSTYDSNESMYAKIKVAGARGGYDIVVPSTDFVARMAREGLLAPIEKSRLKNFGNLDPKLLGQSFDPKNDFSVPYMWGSTATAVNTKKFPAATVASFADLWNPAFAGRLLLPDDARVVMGIGLRALGYSINETDEARIMAAFDRLKALMPSVKVFNSDSAKQPLLAGEVDLGVMWNGEAYAARAVNPAVAYVYPSEGVGLWLDSLCIPAGAKNAAAAHAFIDYILRPDVARMISIEMGYATPNLAAFATLPEELKQNPIVYPPASVMEKGEFETDVGQAAATYEKLFAKLKTGK